ncbi:MAG TPA: ABC transporter permease [Vicinamibacterales bacterium]|nr:ABC transporter permease [Vicinamibacterales bacterium]
MTNLRYALRTLLRNPTPTLVVVFTLAVAIGTSAIISSTIDSVWHAIPAVNTDHLVFVASTDPRPGQAQAGVSDGLARTWTSVPDLVDFAAESSTVEQFAAFQYDTATVTGRGAPARVSLIRTTANLPSLWGITPDRGRGFRDDDGRIGAPPVALLGYRYWQERYASNPSVVGTPIILNGTSHTIVGIQPRSAGGGIFVETEVWLPIPLDATRAAREERRLSVTARLKPGVTRAQATADLSRIAERLKTQYPNTNRDVGVVVRPLIEQLGGEIPFLLFLLTLIAVLLVAMACANVSNVIYAQMLARRRELSLRKALGATRFDHITQLLGEGFTISVVASAVGLLLGAWGLAALEWLAGPQARVLTDAAINSRVVAAGAVASFLIPLGISLIPAWQSWRTDPGDLRGGARSTSGPVHRMRTALVVLQVGLALVLLVQVAFVARTAWGFRTAVSGFDASRLLTFRVDLSDSRFTTPARINQFYSDLLTRIDSLPGVVSAAAINRLPVADRELSVRVRVDGGPPVPVDALPFTAMASVSQQYLDTLRIPIVRGRNFTGADFGGGQPVALVSEDAARLFWPGRNPLGTQLSIVNANEPATTVSVVGVVGNVRSSDVERRGVPQIYVPSILRPERSMAIAVRTSASDPLQLVSAIRAEAAALEPTEPLFAVLSMEQVRFNDLASTYTIAGLLMAVALVAIALAATGIYGVVSYLVEQRTREIGVRMALGARPAQVLRMIIRQGVRPVMGGGLIGLPAALLLVSAMGSAFAFVDVDDPTVYLSVIATIAFVAFAATYVPARRASRVNPMVALRMD